MNLFNKKPKTMEEIKDQMMTMEETKKEMPPPPKPPEPEPIKEVESDIKITNEEIGAGIEFFYTKYLQDMDIMTSNQIQLNTTLANVITRLQRMEIAILNQKEKKK